MLQRPEHCRSCVLERDRIAIGFSQPDGDGSRHLAVVAEALGEHEAAQGKPLVGPAGWLFNRILSYANLKREHLIIDNTIRCRPGMSNKLAGMPYEYEAIEHCRPFLDDTLTTHKPKAIIALGAIATRRLTGNEAKITDVRGYVLSSPYGWTVPVFHTAFLARGLQALCGIERDDFLRADAIARNGFAYDAEDYCLYPTPSDFRSFYQRLLTMSSDTPIACDIETPNVGKIDKADQEDTDDPSYTIIRASFAFRVGEAITVPWQEPYIDTAKHILSLQNAKLFWNGCRYDIPRLKAAGCNIRGFIFDAMRGWQRLYPGLKKERKDRSGGEHESGGVVVKPNRLGFAAPSFCRCEPWKHLSQEKPELYSCRDADKLLQCGLGIERRLRASSQWVSFVEDETMLVPVLDCMERTGVLIDREAQESLRKELEASEGEALERLQREVPISLKPLHPPDGYVRDPKDTSEMVRVQVLASVPSSVPCPQQDMPIVSGSNALGVLPHPKKCLCKGKGVLKGPKVERLVERWAKRLPFSPDSPLQIKEYMKFKGHTIPKHKRTGADTTEADQLRAMAKRFNDPVYRAILDFREASKLKEYIYELPEDSRVRTQYYFASTGRTRSRNVNLQNIPKRKKTADALRRTFIAPEGKYLLSLDFSGIEAILVGYFAGDPDYTSIARLGLHTYMAALLLGNPITNMSKDYFKEAKERAKAERYKGLDTSVYDFAKRSNHALNYLMTDRRLQQENPDLYPHVKDATAYIDLYFGTVAQKVRPWQQATIQQAYSRHELRSPFGDVLQFWDIYKKYKRGGEGAWEWQGEDRKAAVAFLPQNGAARIKRRALMSLKHRAESGELLMDVHDELVLEVLDELLLERAHEARAVMTAPVPELGGLSVDVEISYGRNRADLSESNPEGMRELKL